MAEVTLIDDNRARLVSAVASLQVAPVRISADQFFPEHQGTCVALSGSGGVCLSLHAGDVVDRYQGDHLMPAVSAEDEGASPEAPGAGHLLSCIGNDVYDAAGAFFGVVSGKRGGLAPGLYGPHLISVEAAETRLVATSPGEHLMVRTCGRGLALNDWPDFALLNCSPRLLDALRLRSHDGRIELVVRGSIPSEAVGAGIGQDGWIGDVEMLQGAHAIDALRFGDLVAIVDFDGGRGRFHRPGYTSLGIVVHGPSSHSGHGVGMTMLLAAPSEQLIIDVSPDAGVGRILRAWGAEEA